jgi:hypothetical protein
MGRRSRRRRKGKEISRIRKTVQNSDGRKRLSRWIEGK